MVRPDTALLHQEEAREWWEWLTQAQVLLTRLSEHLPTAEEQSTCQDAAEKLGRIARRVSVPGG